MDDVYLEIIIKSDPNDIQSMCSTNKNYNALCKHYRTYIYKSLLERFSVSYKDPSNFIYIMNGVQYDTNRGLDEIFRLYMKFYNEDEIECDNRKITSIPMYPNLETLDCSKNKLTSLPSYPKLTTLFCDKNQLTSLPSYPKLGRLECSDNKLTSLPMYPDLEILDCSNNKLTSIPNYPNLIECICDDLCDE